MKNMVETIKLTKKFKNEIAVNQLSVHFRENSMDSKKCSPNDLMTNKPRFLQLRPFCPIIKIQGCKQLGLLTNWV